MITLVEAKSHLRVDHTAEDADITLKLKLAVAIVQDYSGADATYGANDIADAATLLVLGELYANREASADPLSPSVKTILGRLRRPVFA